MKRFLPIFALAFLAAPLCTTSCKKDDATASKTELISAKSWTTTKVEFTYAGATNDVTSLVLEDCEKDDLIMFSKDGSYSFKTGADDCNGDEPDEKGSWALKMNETILNVSAPSDTIDFTLVTLTNTTLKVSSKPADFDINGDGKSDDVTETFTFTGK